MTFDSINPSNGELLTRVDSWRSAELEEALQSAAQATPAWAALSIEERCTMLRAIAEQLREQRDDLAGLVTREMGKLLREAQAEIDKCAWVCDYYAEHAAAFLADEGWASDATRSYIAHQPLGTVLAVMPWNFPFWQVFRFAAPALAAGNTAVLKHASNVPQCALAIERVLLDAGLPPGVFRTLLIGSAQVADVIADARVHAVTLTGSEAAGRKVAAGAGQHLKKTVLELGGSDPFVVLEDADLDAAVSTALTSRFLNAGQSCIAAKRFIVVDAVRGAFSEALTRAVAGLRCGDPMSQDTTLAPLARRDLVDELHRQVTESIAAGAVALTGCVPAERAGFFYQPSVLDGVGPGMPAYEEELFGPVAAIIGVRDEREALRSANDTRFGLGGSVWTEDAARGEAFARAVQCGAVFVNGLVKSDPRLPFGGVKASGYGRELSRLGIREFVNAKTVWMR